MTMTREEHLKWCKERALEYVQRGKLEDAVASMASDLTEHPSWRDKEFVSFMVLDACLFCVPAGADAVRRWIEGFN